LKIKKQILEQKKMNRSIGAEEAKEGWEGTRLENSSLDISHLQKAVYKSKIFDMAEAELEEDET